MRYLVLSDIHANIQALDTVLAAAGSAGYDRVVVLGDLVGYGGNPEAVVERIRSLEPVAIVRGNHDKVAAGIEDSSGFNAIARRAALWTRQALSPSSLKYLAALPVGPLPLDESVLICHGSPEDEDLYIFNDRDALRALSAAERLITLFGHTHLPIVVRLVDGTLELVARGTLAENLVAFTPDVDYLVNPGSVGQPRDGDPRAAFAIFDTGDQTIVLHRVAYAIADAQARILEAGLPPSLAHRLSVGR
ncbi:MAG: metallophosphoesterase family protein [Acidobacteria bacterium]|nr:metallophosphoesterase family protein [Acidobacteriota bacterium]